MRWQVELYFDKVLPFGLRSAPIIFTAIADGIEWMIRQRGVHNIFHYVDDFIIVGKPNTQECASALATTLETFSALGVPAEPEKCEGPLTILPILGIEVDTVEMQLRLPADKLHCLNQSGNGEVVKVVGKGSYSHSWISTTCSKSSETRPGFRLPDDRTVHCP